jgi:excisionase family DNA binding protein
VDEGPETYTVDEAARILKLTPGRIRQMLRAGELEGTPPEESGGRGWKIPMHAVHDRDRPARVEHPLRPPEYPETERLSELEVEVRELRYQLGLSRGRIELTEKAESTLRDALERERERADAERERAEKLQAELEGARLPWYRKLFGS